MKKLDPKKIFNGQCEFILGAHTYAQAPQSSQPVRKIPTDAPGPPAAAAAQMAGPLSVRHCKHWLHAGYARGR